MALKRLTKIKMGKEESKSSVEPQLFFAVALFAGSLFLFLGLDLVAFSWAGAGLESRAEFSPPTGANFMQANLTSNHYPIRDYSRKFPRIKTESFLVFDLQNNEILGSKQVEKSLPIASITKLVNALVVQKEKELYLQKEYLKIPQLKDFPVEPQLERGAQYRVQDLFRAMLAASNNEAAYSFAKEYPGGKPEFLKAMHREAKKAGMENFKFSNPAGFDKNGGNYTSAKDLISLVEEISQNHPEILEATLKARLGLKKKEAGETTFLYNTNYFVHNKEGKKLVGQKTGHTSLAGECMVLIEKGEFGKIIYVLLGSGDRVADMRTLLDWTHETYKFAREG